MIVRRPWLTWGLSILFTLTTILFWADLDGWESLIFSPSATGMRYLTGLFGYPLLHADFLHLAGNLYFLIVFGCNVECRFGRRRMLVLFVVASVCGALLHGAFANNGLIGASSGIFGILVLYAVMFPKSRILWLPFGFLVRAAVLAVGREWLPKGMSVITWLVIYMILQMIVVYEQLFMEGDVSALAHIGGGIAGMVVYALWKRGWVP